MKQHDLFPSLQNQGLISIDLETYDPDLKERGPGAHRDGFIAGIAVGTQGGHRAYYPIAHEGGGNIPKDKVIKWLKHELKTDVPKVGANLIYDLGFLAEAGIEVGGPLYDIQIAEPLIDETRRSYSLENLAQSYLQTGKFDSEMQDWICSNLKDKNGRKIKAKYKAYIYKAPAHIVAPYAISDIDLPLKIFELQKPKLEALGLWDLFEMEIKLIPMLLAMRRRGVRVDVPNAERLYASLKRRQSKLQRALKDIAGDEVEPWKAKSIAHVFDKLGIPYSHTAVSGAPSFTKEFLKHHTSPVAGIIREIRHLDKLKETFIKGFILDGSYKGRIHCQFNQLRSDENGTVTGRMSSSSPNLQQIPVRGDDGKAIRSLFIPDEGELWYRTDWQQVEYRLIANDAAHFEFRGAQEVVDIFNSNPDADFHQIVADMTGLPRDAAKTVNFAMAYGAGINKLCESLGLERNEGEALLRNYHHKAPFMRPVLQHWKERAESKREIRTLLGRRRQYNRWTFKKGNTYVTIDHRIPGAQLAHTYAALNARIQGSAADVLKKAMVDIWESGVCNVLGPPLLVVHDELDMSVPDTKAGHEAAAEVKHLMENAIELSLKLTVDASFGSNWGSCK